MASNGADQGLSKAIESYLARRGGTVVERLVAQMKKTYREDAPELQSNEALKAFVAKNSDVFKIITSCNSVERVKLVNPPKRERRRHNSLLMDVTIKLLEDMGCTEEAKATPLSELYSKASAEYTKRVAAKQAGSSEDKSEVDASPPELASEDDFARALGPRRRVTLRTGRVWLQPPQPREGGRSPRGPRGRGPRAPREGGEGEDANGWRPRGERRGREPRTPQPVGVPKEIELADDANDSTLIAKLVYDKLKTRSAESVETGLPIKVVLRIVSLAFKEGRPSVEATAMSSLRVFKHLLSELPGVSRERPPRRRQPEGRSQSRRPPPPLETVVWIADEDALVAAIKGGLSAELAHVDVTPEVMENNDNAQQGVPVVHKVLNQETWVTTVIGPTSSEEVLKKFLADNADQQIWGFETEHRVGLARRPAGNIAIIAISSLTNTFLWDSHNGGIPDCLHSWLADDRFFKGGVKVGPKAQKLRVQFAAAPKQFVELTVIAQALDYIEEAGKAGMRVISKNVLNLPVNRPPGIRDSNWELRPLTKGQYHYAIEDAYVSALLFVHMSAKLHKLDRGEMLMKAAINLE